MIAVELALRSVINHERLLWRQELRDSHGNRPLHNCLCWWLAAYEQAAYREVHGEYWNPGPTWFVAERTRGRGLDSWP
jgi:hypothetical protein